MQVSKKSGKHSNGKIFTSFDVITYALVKIFPLLRLPDFLETCIVLCFFPPDETLEQGRNASR